jgi:hypothetical protein
MKLKLQIIIIIILAFVMGLLLGYLLFNKPEVVMANCTWDNVSQKVVCMSPSR